MIPTDAASLSDSYTPDDSDTIQIQIFIGITHLEYLTLTMNETLNYLQTNTSCNSKPIEVAIGKLGQD